MERTYKGHTICKQTVANCGWNIVSPNGKVMRVGVSTLSEAKEIVSRAVDLTPLN